MDDGVQFVIGIQEAQSGKSNPLISQAMTRVMFTALNVFSVRPLTGRVRACPEVGLELEEPSSGNITCDEADRSTIVLVAGAGRPSVNVGRWLSVRRFGDCRPTAFLLGRVARSRYIFQPRVHRGCAGIGPPGRKTAGWIAGSN